MCVYILFSTMVCHRILNKWHPTPVFLPGKSHGRRSLVGFSQSMGSQKSQTRLSDFTFTLPVLYTMTLSILYIPILMDLLISRHTEANNLQCPYSGQQPEEEMFYFSYGSVLSFKHFFSPVFKTVHTINASCMYSTKVA